MSLIYQHSSGGRLYQAGAKEIPEILQYKNISLLVLAAEEYQPEHISGTKGVTVIYVPLKDTILFSTDELAKTINNAQIVANHVVDYIEQGKNVLSTCWAGLNRSGLISGLAMVELSYLSGKQVVNQIRKQRSRIALSNPLFAKIVISSSV